MDAPFNWEKLERLEEAIVWRRELENLPLSHVWHLETVADLAVELRRLMMANAADEHLIAMLWERIDPSERVIVRDELVAPGSRRVDAAFRLGEIVDGAT